MKIGKIETFYIPPRWLFVRVESDDGAVGWGEASLEGWADEAVAVNPHGKLRRLAALKGWAIEDWG